MYCVFCGGLLDINDRCPGCGSQKKTDKVLVDLGDKVIVRLRFMIKKDEFLKLRKQRDGEEDGGTIN